METNDKMLANEYRNKVELLRNYTSLVEILKKQKSEIEETVQSLRQDLENKGYRFVPYNLTVNKISGEYLHLGENVVAMDINESVQEVDVDCNKCKYDYRFYIDKDTNDMQYKNYNLSTLLKLSLNQYRLDHDKNNRFKNKLRTKRDKLSILQLGKTESQDYFVNKDMKTIINNTIIETNARYDEVSKQSGILKAPYSQVVKKLYDLRMDSEYLVPSMIINNVLSEFQSKANMNIEDYVNMLNACLKDVDFLEYSETKLLRTFEDVLTQEDKVNVIVGALNRCVPVLENSRNKPNVEQLVGIFAPIFSSLGYDITDNDILQVENLVKNNQTSNLYLTDDRQERVEKNLKVTNREVQETEEKQV